MLRPRVFKVKNQWNPQVYLHGPRNMVFDKTVGHLTNIITSFISEKKFPNNLKTAYVPPMFKKDDPDNPENYRPISVTSSLSKVFERLQQKQIVLETTFQQSMLFCIAPSRFDWLLTITRSTKLLFLIYQKMLIPSSITF